MFQRQKSRACTRNAQTRGIIMPERAIPPVASRMALSTNQAVDRALTTGISPMDRLARKAAVMAAGDMEMRVGMRLKRVYFFCLSIMFFHPPCVLRPPGA